MTRTTYTVNTDDGQTLTIHNNGEDARADVHLHGRESVYTKTFRSGGEDVGCISIGPLKVFCDPELVRRIEKAVLGYEADRARGAIEKRIAPDMARLRADAQSDDGTRVADADFTARIRQDYARLKGRA